MRETLQKYGLVEKLGEDHIQPHITPALAKAREDGTLAALSLKYFNADLTNPM